jgi:tetratricopeptide (TPR) repeat protein
VTTPLASRAAAALDLVGRDARLALDEADAVVAQANGSSEDVAAASLAHRVAGLALRGLGDLAGAEARARTGVRVASRSGAEQAAAEARMSLAFILLDRGRLRAALAEADRAAEALTGLPAVRLTCQRALILQRTGRLDEALAGYAAALPALRRAGDLLWQARLHNNRGLLHAHRGTLAPAEADFVRASALWDELGQPVYVAESECNLGNVAALSGDAPSALAAYDRAEATPALQAKPIPQVLLNRCQVLLSVGLFDDARRTAERAVTDLDAIEARADLAEARLWLAQAAFASGQSGVASREAAAARSMFTRQGRPGWAALARLVALRVDGPSVPAALSCAAELASLGWRAAELDARLIAAGSALSSGDLATAESVLESSVLGRRSGTMETRVRGWHATALLRHARGDRRGALSALRAGLALVEQRQAVLGATELRVHVAAFGAELASLGLSLAIETGSPRVVLAWAERARARALRLRPVKPPHDKELAQALSELRRLTAQGAQASLAGAARPHSAAARRAAEERVVAASRVARSPLHRPEGAPPPVAELVGALGNAVLVEFVLRGDELLAVTVGSDGCRLRRVASMPAVRAALDSAVGALRALGLSFGTPRGRAAIRAAAVVAGARLDTLLLSPLGIGDRPVVIVPTRGLHSVPWGLIPSLLAVPVRVAPSAAAWLRAVRSPSSRGGRTMLAAGPDLPAARAEVSAIGRRVGAVPLVGARATVHAVLSAIDGADLAHIACHGRLRDDNPLLSALELADGPLTVYDLERLTQAPGTVVLPACQSGVTAVRAGDEILGLVGALLALGTRTVLATVVPVSDVDTAPLMISLHDALRSGLPPAEAMVAARSAVDPGDDGAVAAGASFVCFGG